MGIICSVLVQDDGCGAKTKPTLAQWLCAQSNKLVEGVYTTSRHTHGYNVGMACASPLGQESDEDAAWVLIQRYEGVPSPPAQVFIKEHSYTGMAFPSSAF